MTYRPRQRLFALNDAQLIYRVDRQFIARGFDMSIRSAVSQWFAKPFARLTAHPAGTVDVEIFEKLRAQV